MIFLFDLDGTLADTGEGVMNSAAYALERMGFPPLPLATLKNFLGPPLVWSFQEYAGMSPQQAVEATEHYRVRYSENGVLENHLYPGMKELLAALSPLATLGVATSKPLVYARQVLDMGGITEYFQVIVGADMEGKLSEKPDVIREALRQLGNPPKEQVRMIGDRRHDVWGAKENGIPCIGADFGYAMPGELWDAGACAVVRDCPSLLALCLQIIQQEGGREHA